jgi:hypothetical protein
VLPHLEIYGDVKPA